MPRNILRSALACLLVLASFSTPASAAKLIIGQAQRLVATDPLDDKSFGKIVAIDGDTAVVGAQGDTQFGEGSGAVYIFVRSSAGGWAPHPSTPKLVSSAGADQVGFGGAVAISGTALLVGSELRSTQAGTAFVFRRSGAAATSAWAQEQQLTPTGVVTADLFGVSVALSGDTAIVGAPGNNSNSGAAYVFFRTPSATPLWGLQDSSPTPACTPRPCRCTAGTCKLVASPSLTNSNFGAAVALDGSLAIVGAPAQGDAGAAFTFQQSNGIWDAGVALTVPAAIGAPVTDDGFGFSVALSGSWALIGAPHSNVNFISDAGTVFFFERSAGAWVARQRVNTPVPLDTGEFGSSVALTGLRAAVGAPGENGQRGFLHMFSREPSTWRRSQPPISSGGAEQTLFGSAIALGTDALMTGATEEPCVSGICTHQGAAYIFAVSDAPAVPLLGGGALSALAALLGACGARRLRKPAARVAG